MDADLSEVETRLLSILKRAAASALANGRADSVVTTERQFWNLHEGQGEGDRMLGLPKAPGAARVRRLGRKEHRPGRRLAPLRR